MMFEDFASDQVFDLCLFSESFQYIPMDVSLPKAARLAPGGHVIVSDNFRTPQGQVQVGNRRNVGSGHALGFEPGDPAADHPEKTRPPDAAPDRADPHGRSVCDF